MGWKEFLKRRKKFCTSKPRIVKPTVYNRFSIPCDYRCPVCNSELKSGPSAVAPFIYYCRKCGYSGPVFVKPEKKKKK